MPKNTIKMGKTVKNLDHFLTLSLDHFLTLKPPNLGPLVNFTAYIYMPLDPSGAGVFGSLLASFPVSFLLHPLQSPSLAFLPFWYSFCKTCLFPFPFCVSCAPLLQHAWCFPLEGLGSKLRNMALG